MFIFVLDHAMQNIHTIWNSDSIYHLITFQNLTSIFSFSWNLQCCSLKTAFIFSFCYLHQQCLFHSFINFSKFIISLVEFVFFFILLYTCTYCRCHSLMNLSIIIQLISHIPFIPFQFISIFLVPTLTFLNHHIFNTLQASFFAHFSLFLYLVLI